MVASATKQMPVLVTTSASVPTLIHSESCAILNWIASPSRDKPKPTNKSPPMENNNHFFFMFFDLKIKNYSGLKSETL